MDEDTEGRYYCLEATSVVHAKSLAAKSRRHFGEGYQRGRFVIVGPTSQRPWAWREALPAGGDWDMYSGETPAAAAEAAGIQL